MTPRQWRERGFKTIFRDGQRYLYDRALAAVYLLPTTEGMWADEDNLAACRRIDLDIFGPTASLHRDIRLTVAACYCDQGVDTCDFCTGLRTPPSLEVPDPTPYELADICAFCGVALREYPDHIHACPSCGCPTVHVGEDFASCSACDYRSGPRGEGLDSPEAMRQSEVLTPYALTDAEAAAEAAAEQEAFEAQDAALDAELARLPAVTWTEEDAAEAERRDLARHERGWR